ncbi:MAG: HAD family phosphatase [Candidatus Marsarchaeota archaeon]|nr:HAD family phosphatase [Candidatus Marsarchaeota archaeon]
MIKLIIFDLGGVLVLYDDKDYYSYLSKRYAIPEKKISNVASKYNAALYKGKIKNNKFLKSMSKELGIQRSKLNPEKYFLKKARLNKELLKFAERLRTNYKVVILTNIYFSRYNSAMKILKKESFDGIIASCFIGMMKPNKNIYRYVLKKYKVEPKEAIFVDNLSGNVSGARSLGINGILFSGNDLLFKKFSNFKIKA